MRSSAGMTRSRPVATSRPKYSSGPVTANEASSGAWNVTRLMCSPSSVTAVTVMTNWSKTSRRFAGAIISSAALVAALSANLSRAE